MKLIKPSIRFLWVTPDPLGQIEMAGRVCYKSEAKITTGSQDAFAKKILASGHEAVIEHASASYRVITDRGVTHEIVRHRLFSYCQESTRYCNYKGGVTFIIPPWLSLPEGNYTIENHSGNWEAWCQENPIPTLDSPTGHWLDSLWRAEETYCYLLENPLSWTPQEARGVLPNALKTEIVITGNLREWRHFFKLRASPNAHPQMQEVAFILLEDIRSRVPILFDEFPKEV